jgi:NitT/TauT family transport system permease protein
VLAQIWPRAAIVALIVLVWWAVYETGYWHPLLLPSPADVWNALASNLTGPDGLLAVAYRSLFRLTAGFALAIVIGTPVGLSMAAWRLSQRSIGSLMAGLQALPAIAWLPLAILWFGINEKAVLFVVVMGGLPAVAIAAAASVRLVPPNLTRAARTLGARRSVLYRRVVVPAAVPEYVAGLRQAWAIAWRSLMAAELLLAGARGLGHLLNRAGQELDTPLLLATMIVIMIVGLLVDALFSFVDRRVRRKRGLLMGA